MTLPILKNKNIIIIGDVMLDQFYYGNLEDTSKEDPLAKILKVNNQSDNLGGAGNVAMNIKALESTPHLIAVVGDDVAGKRISLMCEKYSIANEGIFIDQERKTTAKTRLYDDDQIIRFDQEDVNPIPIELEDNLITYLEQLIASKTIDGVILQDYNKGVLSKSSIKRILTIASTNQLPVYVDPKKENFFEYQGVSIFKPNLREINWALPDTEIDEAAEIIMTRLGSDIIAITLSEKGIHFKDQSTEYSFPALSKSIVDVCGAGDTVIAVLCLSHISKCNMKQMGILANLAAANVCQSRGVIPIVYEKLDELYTSHHQDKEKYDIA